MLSGEILSSKHFTVKNKEKRKLKVCVSLSLPFTQNLFRNLASMHQLLPRPRQTTAKNFLILFEETDKISPCRQFLLSLAVPQYSTMLLARLWLVGCVDTREVEVRKLR
jgi:hypothetical protein